VVFVSHDRYFIDKLATRVFEIEDGEVRIFPGNYEDYLWRKSGKPLDLSVAVSVPVNGSSAAPVAEPEKSGPLKRVNPMKVQKLKDRCSALEAAIASHETQIASLEADLANFRSSDETLRVTKLLDEKRTSLEGLMTEWEQVSAEIEASTAV
jgi:ATP-binding cassette subfamily F protein 3